MTRHRKPSRRVTVTTLYRAVTDWLHVLADWTGRLAGWLYALAGCTDGRIWWVKVGWYVTDPVEEWGEL